MTSEELAARLKAEGLEPTTWGNGPGDRYAPHEHEYDKVLVCAEGSVRFRLPSSGGVVDLPVGDRLDLPAGTPHDAVVGRDGVACLEAHLPAGRLASICRHAAGTW